jgi:hypothetical protein
MFDDPMSPFYTFEELPEWATHPLKKMTSNDTTRHESYSDHTHWRPGEWVSAKEVLVPGVVGPCSTPMLCSEFAVHGYIHPWQAMLDQYINDFRTDYARFREITDARYVRVDPVKFGAVSMKVGDIVNFHYTSVDEIRVLDLLLEAMKDLIPDIGEASIKNAMTVAHKRQLLYASFVRFTGSQFWEMVYREFSIEKDVFRGR